MAGGEYAITMYDLYMKMLKDCHGGVDERVKMDTIAAIIKDFHLKALTVDNDIVESLLAYYSRAEISDFVSKWTKLRLNEHRG